MFGDGSLTLREFAMREPHPLASIHDATLNFLRNREDAVLFGAQAVNAYVDEARMTQNVNILSTRAQALAEELRTQLAETFKIAVHVREVAGGQGFRVYQMREPKNRDLADVRQVATFPPTQLIADVRVPIPEELIAQKVISLCARSSQPKGGTDRRDLKLLLLLTYPHLKSEAGPVQDCLRAGHADEAALAQWRQLAATRIEAGDDDAGY